MENSSPPSPEKVELKRGPWSHEEDQILSSFVQKNGIGNWRALPEKAGLVRCGKSCRLRWTNYLRPDIKRGKLTKEEEDTIFRLHEVLGNKWSAIAAELPGRTDNEIKNMWNAHLKKKLKTSTVPTPESSKSAVTSPQQSSSGISNSSTDKAAKSKEIEFHSPEFNSQTDDNAWMERLTNDDDTCWKVESVDNADRELQFPVEKESTNVDRTPMFPVEEDSPDFWFNLLTKVGDIKELPKF